MSENAMPKPVAPKIRPIPFERTEHLMHHPFAGLRTKAEMAGVLASTQKTDNQESKKAE